MVTYTRNNEACPKLLDLIPKDEEWFVKMEKSTSLFHSEEKKLELRLGPPDGDWNNKKSSKIIGCFSNTTTLAAANNPISGKDHVFSAAWSSKWDHYQPSSQCLPVMSKESSHHCPSTKGTVELQTGENKAFSSPSANTAVPTCNSAQKRTAPAPVVGWPPVRSFRRNLATSSNSKQNHASQNAVSNQTCSEKPVENGQKGLFVKINMDGVAIGRKVDLKAHGSYEKLSSAVDELFRGLLAAQGDDSLTGGMKIKREGEKNISGLLDGSGEYTLVYEDNEGDRMLVGDVPWHMFVSTVRRLRVLKTSEISSLCRGSKHREALC